MPDFGEQLLREDLRGEGGASNLAFNEKVKGLQAAGQRIFHFAFGQFSPSRFDHLLQASRPSLCHNLSHATCRTQLDAMIISQWPVFLTSGRPSSPSTRSGRG